MNHTAIFNNSNEQWQEMLWLCKNLVESECHSGAVKCLVYFAGPTYSCSVLGDRPGCVRYSRYGVGFFGAGYTHEAPGS